MTRRLRNLILAGAAVLGAGVGVHQLTQRELPPEVDFLVDFGRLEAPLDGAGRGWNALGWEESNAWVTAGKVARPAGGLARIWISYATQVLNDSHRRACRQALENGQEIYVSLVGSQEHRRPPGERLERPNAWPPSAAPAWAERGARDVLTLLEEGFPVRWVSIWNEPDLGPDHWRGERQAFLDFYAAAGRHLRDRLPDQVKVGGPDLGRGYGPSIELLEDLVDAAVGAGWSPEFVAHHAYAGYPTDLEAFDLAGRLEQLLVAGGAEDPEVFLTEYAVGLPGLKRHGRTGDQFGDQALDDHRNAAHLVGVQASLGAYAGAAYFFLADTNLEARGRDYEVGLNGLVTVHGGPKAVLQALGLVRQVTELGRPHVERVGAWWNVSVLAGRTGRSGLVLVSNVFGDEIKRARKAIDQAGLPSFAGWPKELERPLEDYLRGRGTFEDLDLDPELGLEEILRPGRESVARGQLERRRRDRRVVLAVRQPPAGLSSVHVIGPGRGVAQESIAFLEAFEAAQRLDPGPARDEALAALAFRPDALPLKVPAEDWALLEGKRLEIRCPRDHVVLVGLDWGRLD